jgi:antitoxin component YwqK of YwqJK toxin-antitoxin module
MNKNTLSFIFIISLLLFAGCNYNKRQKKVDEANPGTTAVSDTGFTGIMQYKSKNIIFKEVTFKNGVRDGLMKSFYMGGQLYQTFWYENGLKEDSVRWYYLEGQLFRTTPYKHDTVDGIQKQFYRNGKLKAKIGYSKGMRTMFFQEFTPDGKLVNQYPEITVSIQDSYKNNGTYTINLGLTDKNTKVRFFSGGLIDERFDTTKCKYIKPISEKSTIILMKSNKPGPDHLDIVASISTLFGNKYLEYKKIDLPYNDLNWLRR